MLSVSESKQPFTGLTPPQTREAPIRVTWPALTQFPAVAALGKRLILSYVLAPLGWFLMLPFYFMKVMPVVGIRYTLTNKRVMIQRGWKRTVSQEIALADIDDVHIVEGSRDHFFRSATLEFVSQGQVKLKLVGVGDPEVFRQAIRNACMAWVPDRARKWLQFIPAKADGK
jgi:PH (Pleckstrin Homology) domain-containing protein